MPVPIYVLEFLEFWWQKSVASGSYIAFHMKEVEHTAVTMLQEDEKDNWNQFLNFLNRRGLMLLRGRSEMIMYRSPYYVKEGSK
jgi:hypothetical protein